MLPLNGRLTIPQIGQLFAWAFNDANDGWFDTTEVELEEVLDCRTSAADRLRNLLLWSLEHLPANWKLGPRPDAHQRWLREMQSLMTRMPKDL